jgi:hypothetical protein
LMRESIRRYFHYMGLSFAMKAEGGLKAYFLGPFFEMRAGQERMLAQDILYTITPPSLSPSDWTSA